MDQSNPFLFEADFRDNEVFINQTIRYATNEMLTEILCSEPDYDNLQRMSREIQRSFQAAFPPTDKETYSEIYIEEFDSKIMAFAKVIEEIDQFRLKFPPYNRMYPNPHPLNRVFSILDEYPHIWDDSYAECVDLIIDDSPLINYRKYTPFSLKNPESYPVNWISPNAPITDFHEVISELHDLAMECFDFLVDCYFSYKRYQDLIENYIHIKNHFPTMAELAKSFQQYDKNNPEKPLNQIFLATNITSSLCVIEKDGIPAITERYSFEDTSAFIYVDFIRGLHSNYLPKRCANCGRWFLIPGGKYLEYCSRPLENDPSKTCRDVGAHQSYTQKCKNNPIWETYQRAYKTHFARRKKGKMTPDEFRVWADNAIIWRGQAERGELDFDTYYAMIRK